MHPRGHVSGIALLDAMHHDRKLHSHSIIVTATLSPFALCFLAAGGNIAADKETTSGLGGLASHHDCHELSANFVAKAPKPQVV